MLKCVILTVGVDWSHDLTDPHEKIVALEDGAENDETSTIKHMQNYEVAEDARVPTKEARAKDATFRLMPNKRMGMAIDNALKMGIGKSLRDFLVQHRCGPLAVGEERRLVPLPMIAAVGGTSRFRSVVYNASTGASRVELPRGRDPTSGKVLQPLTLHKVQDEGAIGLPVSFWMDSHRGGILGTTTEDICHRIFNDLKSALIQSGTWICVMEHTIVYNTPRGPFGSQAFLGQISAAATRFFKTHDEKSVLFRLAYPDITKEQGLCSAMMGTDDHIKQVWERAKVCTKFLTTGANVKLGRWHSFFNSAKSWKPWRSTYLMILNYFWRGWWQCLNELPSLNGFDFTDGDESEVVVGAAEAAGAAAGSSSSSGSAPPAVVHLAASTAFSASAVVSLPSAPGSSTDNQPRSVRASNEVLNKLRHSCKNNVHLSACVLSNRYSCQMVDALGVVCSAANEFFAKTRTILKTTSGSVDWKSKMVGGEMTAVLLTMMHDMCDASSCSIVGFTPASEWDLVPPAGLQEECALAMTMMKTGLGLMYNLLTTSMTWSHRLPGFFAGLVGCTAEQRDARLKILKGWWEKLQELEMLAPGDDFVKGLLRDLVWPDCAWVRQTFVMLFECQFQYLSEELEARLLQFAKAFASTEMCEAFFKHCRDRERASPSGVFSRLSRYHCATTSKLLAEYDKTEVRVTAASASASSGKPPLASTFQQLNPTKFSLGREALGTLGDGSYASPSPQSWKLAGLAWLAATEGDVGRLSASWLSLLCPPGVLMMDKHTKELPGGLVFASTTFGLLVWKLDRLELGSFRCWVSKSRPGNAYARCPWYLHPVTTTDSVFVHPATMVPPAEVRKSCPADASVPDGMVFAKIDRVAKQQPLLQFAARDGFSQLNCFFLKKLMVRLGLRALNGREADLVRRLIKHSIPEMPEEEIQAILKKRGARTPDAMQSILQHQENLDFVGDILEPDDHTMLKDHVKSTKLRKSKAPKEKPEYPGPGVGKDGGAVGQKWEVRPFPTEPHWSLANAKEFLPPRSGCTLTKDEKRFSRWSSFYPRDCPPRHITKSWGPQTGLNVQASLEFVLSTVWKWHTECTGERCPFEWTSVKA